MAVVITFMACGMRGRLSALVCVAVLHQTVSIDSPVIGVMAQPALAPGQQYVAASYVKFVEMAGGRAVPLSYAMDNATSLELYGQLNGVLFPGGASALPDAARAAVAYSEAAARRGEVFPVWGTCLGFEWLMEIVGGPGVVTPGFNASNVSLPLALTPAAATSKMYGGAAKEGLRASLASEALALNNHHMGVTPGAFRDSAALSATFEVLSTNVDGGGEPFVSSAESKTGHLFAVQWHPEKNAFEHGERDGLPFEAINHGADAVAATAALATTFVDVARRSTQTFPGRDAFLAYRCAKSDAAYPAFQEVYFFPGNWTGAVPAC